MLGVLFITSLKSNLCPALTTENINKIAGLSHAHNTIALQINVILTRIHRLLVTNKGELAFPSADNCHGQRRTPQSVSVALQQTGLYPSHTSPKFLSAKKSIFKLSNNPYVRILQLIQHHALPPYSNSFALCQVTSRPNAKQRF